MLVIREKQIRELEAVMLIGFEQRLLEHVKEYFPTHWRIVGPEQIARVIGSGIGRARDAGYPTERDGYMFVSLMLYFGSHFDTDPQYPWMPATLDDDVRGAHADRLQILFEDAMAFLDEISGANGEHMSAALKRVDAELPAEMRRAREINLEYALGYLDSIWPQKCARVGDAALRNLVHAAVPVARSAGIITPEGAFLYVLASFLFGHGIDRDLQFPWVGNILSQAIPDAQAKAAALQQAFATHLASVMS